MSSRRGTNKRRAAPEKFENHPDIPSDEEGDDVPVDEEEILEGSEDEVYEGSNSDSYAESDDEGVSSEEGESPEEEEEFVNTSDDEEVPPPKKKPAAKPKAKKAPAKTAVKKAPVKTAAKPKAKKAPVKPAVKKTVAKKAPAKTAAKPAVKKTAAKKPAAKPKATTRRKKADDDDEEPGKRYFKILVDSINPESGSPTVPIGDAKDELSSNGGRYTGKNPMQAAKKAFTRICRVAADGGECTYVFSVQETTQSSAKKVFTYRGVRKELDEPQEVTKGETSYSIRFNSEVRSYKPGGTKSKSPVKAKKTPAKKPAAKAKAPVKKASPVKKTAGRGRPAAKPKATTSRVRGKK